MSWGQELPRTAHPRREQAAGSRGVQAYVAGAGDARPAPPPQPVGVEAVAPGDEPAELEPAGRVGTGDVQHALDVDRGQLDEGRREVGDVDRTAALVLEERAVGSGGQVVHEPLVLGGAVTEDQ